MSTVSIKDLLESGVHFGHQTRRWNPKMKKYIFSERNGIYIIDLQKTLQKIEQACQIVRDTVQRSEPILFVGTKKQSADIIKEQSERCGMFYVSQRWLGGTLTNFATIQKSIKRLREVDRTSEDGTYEKLTKKEVLGLEKERAKLQRALGGIRDMGRLPGLVFVVDTKKERIAVLEAKKLEIPVVAIVDTNCDPDLIDCPIPGNDDAIRSISLITGTISEAVMEAQSSIVAEQEEGENGQEE